MRQRDDETCVGEVGLLPLYLGATDRLLNADHEKVYFEGMPMYNGMVRSTAPFLEYIFIGKEFNIFKKGKLWRKPLETVKDHEVPELCKNL